MGGQDWTYWDVVGYASKNERVAVKRSAKCGFEAPVPRTQPTIETSFAAVKARRTHSKEAPWTCAACTLENKNAHAPVCELCGTRR